MAGREKMEAEAEAQRERFAAERTAREARFEQAIGQVVAAAADGDLTQRVDAAGLDGVMERVGQSVNTLLARSEPVFGAVQGVTAAMAAGDLRRRLPARSEESRVGKEWVRTCEFRWFRDQLK